MFGNIVAVPYTFPLHPPTPPHRSLERAVLSGQDVEELKEVVDVLEEASARAKEKGTTNDNTELQEEQLGSNIYLQILQVMPRQAWTSLTEMLPTPELKTFGKSCKGLYSLARPAIQRRGHVTIGTASTEMEELAIALFNLQAFGRERLQGLAEGDPEGIGFLRVLQTVCVLLGNQWLELEDVWPVIKFVFRSRNPMVALAEKARDPEQVTWEQATWVLSILDAHADEMGVACTDLLGAVLTLVISLLECVRLKHPNLKPLRVPKGYTAPSVRPKDQLNVVTSITLAHRDRSV